MADARHSHLFKHERFEHSRLGASLSKHTLAWSIVAFLAIVALLLALFEWLQVLPEQVAMSVNTPGSTKPAAQSMWQVSQKNLPDPFLEQKKAARDAHFPDQF